MYGNLSRTWPFIPSWERNSKRKMRRCHKVLALRNISSVFSFQQRAVCTLRGDRVKCGDVIGEIPEQGLGARIHASMDGVVKSVDGAVVIGK